MSIFSQTDRKVSFSDVISPISTEVFFSEYYDRKPLHIPGGAEKFKGLMDWSILTRLLNQNAIWSNKSLVLQADRFTIPASAYCSSQEDRSGNFVQRPIPDKVMEFLRDGASLVAGDIDTLSPELCAMADAFEAAFDAKVQTNLYCSWKQRQAFNSHFDTHDVFAVHVEGEKVWRVYSTRIQHPIRHPRHQNDTYDEPTHEKQRGPLMMEIKMTPGDILYLPRGWYHDALAASDGTVHMAYGVTGVIGMDLLGALSDFAVEDEAFRVNLPRAEEGPEAMAAVLSDLGDRLQALSKTPELVDAVRKFQSGFRYTRMGYDLPVKTQDRHFMRNADDLKVVRQNGRAALVSPRSAVPIPPGQEKIVEWVVSRKKFARAEYLDAHPSIATAELDRLILELINMGIIQQQR